MLKYIPVPVSEHDTILGVDFSRKFAKEMHDYYAPFVKKKRKVQLAKETWEYAVTDSIPQAQHAGSGNSMIDVVTPTANIDVKGLSIKSLKTGLTTEASFLQILKKSGDTINTLFESNNFQGLKTMFVDAWLAKASRVSNVYLFVVVRESHTKRVNYCLFRTEPNDLTEAEFVQDMTVKGERGVNVPLIDSKFGSTYINVAKRRLELRVNPGNLSDYLVYSHTTG
jgi:hypothetical protein